MRLLSKSDARAFGKGVRALMSARERLEAAERIAERCQNAVGWRRIARAHIFMSIARNFEVDTHSLLNWMLSSEDIQVFVPRMDNHRVVSERVTTDTKFEIGEYGIAEPAAAGAVAEGQLDLIFVPLLAFDSLGHRVGYGGGHYDQFLAQQPKALKVGLAYDASRLRGTIIETKEHDVRLDMVVTEVREYHFTR